MTRQKNNARAGTEPMTSTMRSIQLRGVRVNNLHGIDLDLPLHKLIVVTGVSGAGKSSLAFGTLYAEGQRRFVESFSTGSRQLLQQMERPAADRIEHIPPPLAIRSPRSRYSRRTTLAALGDLQAPLQLLFARLGKIVCPDCRIEVAAHTPATVREFVESLPPGRPIQIGFAVDIAAAKSGSAGSQPWWHALRAKGHARLIVAGGTLHLHDLTAESPALPDAGEALVVLDRVKSGRGDSRLTDSLELAFAEGDGECAILVESPSNEPDVSPAAPSRITADGRLWRVHRFSVWPICGVCRREFPVPEPRLFNFNTPLGACPKCRGSGIVSAAATARSPQSPPSLLCPDCHGQRYHPLALAVQVGGLQIAEWCGKPVRDVIPLLQEVARSIVAKPSGPTAAVVTALATRLRHLDSLALGYLSLDRSANTLSAGEIKRTLLAAALSSNLVNMLVVIDEPAAGMHASERDKLFAALQQLRNAPNTLVVIEHDPQVIRRADWMVEIGPGAGADGGRLIYAGPPAGSTAAMSLPGKTTSPISNSPPRREPTGWLRLERVRHRNLQGIDVAFPLGVFCVVTGVGGSGKRSLVMETLVSALVRVMAPPAEPAGLPPADQVACITGADQVRQLVVVDQLPVSRAPRSVVATSLGVFAQIRTLFAETNEAKIHNFGAAQFSFNASTGGGCPTCEGTGTLAVDMQILPDVSMTCPDCHGSRYRREILEVKYRGLNLAEVLAQTVRDAFPFFRGQARIQRRLKYLKDVGLDYLTLGRSVVTLSNGESQRLKLATSLASGTRPGTLFVFQEPAGGLQRADVERLVTCLHSMLDSGCSLIVIENRAEILAAADWQIELGPGSGDQGGHVVFAGVPESRPAE